MTNIEILYRGCVDRLSITLEEFAHAIKEFDLVRLGGGVVMINGNELHCACLPDQSGKWITRKRIREVMLPLLKKHGYLTTCVGNDNPNGKSFVARFGFQELERHRDYTQYILVSLPYA